MNSKYKLLILFLLVINTISRPSSTLYIFKKINWILEEEKKLLSLESFEKINEQIKSIESKNKLSEEEAPLLKKVALINSLQKIKENIEISLNQTLKKIDILLNNQKDKKLLTEAVMNIEKETSDAIEKTKLFIYVYEKNKNILLKEIYETDCYKNKDLYFNKISTLIGDGNKNLIEELKNLIDKKINIDASLQALRKISIDDPKNVTI